jgi:predicted phosphohydrolase
VIILAIYVLGDPHLSLSGEKPMDIFGARWEKHSEKIKNAWLTTVKEDDTVVLAGDISWAMALKDAQADLGFFHELPGKKILLKGNHDYWWETVAKMTRFFEEKGWDDFLILFNNSYSVEGVSICGTRGWEVDKFDEQAKKMIPREIQRLEHSLANAPKGEEKIVFFHYPPIVGAHNPFMPLLKKYGVKQVFYGHLHGKKAVQTQSFTVKGIEFALISADALGFKPLKISPKSKKTSKIQQICQKTARFFAKLLSQFGGKC